VRSVLWAGCSEVDRDFQCTAQEMRRGSWRGVLNASNSTYLLVEGREYVETDCGVERGGWVVRW